jgi:hypothetical protein
MRSVYCALQTSGTRYATSRYRRVVCNVNIVGVQNRFKSSERLTALARSRAKLLVVLRELDRLPERVGDVGQLGIGG